MELDDGANWGVTTGVSDMYAKTANWTFTSGASTTLTFYGTKVWLYAAKAFDQAIMSLSLDGSTAATIDNLPVLVIVNVCVPRVSKGESHTSAAASRVAESGLSDVLCEVGVTDAA